MKGRKGGGAARVVGVVGLVGGGFVGMVRLCDTYCTPAGEKTYILRTG